MGQELASRIQQVAATDGAGNLTFTREIVKIVSGDNEDRRRLGAMIATLNGEFNDETQKPAPAGFGEKGDGFIYTAT